MKKKLHFFLHKSFCIIACHNFLYFIIIYVHVSLPHYIHKPFKNKEYFFLIFICQALPSMEPHIWNEINESLEVTHFVSQLRALVTDIIIILDIRIVFQCLSSQWTESFIRVWMAFVQFFIPIMSTVLAYGDCPVSISTIIEFMNE